MTRFRGFSGYLSLALGICVAILQFGNEVAASTVYSSGGGGYSSSYYPSKSSNIFITIIEQQEKPEIIIKPIPVKSHPETNPIPIPIPHKPDPVEKIKEIKGDKVDKLLKKEKVDKLLDLKGSKLEKLKELKEGKLEKLKDLKEAKLDKLKDLKEAKLEKLKDKKEAKLEKLKDKKEVKLEKLGDARVLEEPAENSEEEEIVKESSGNNESAEDESGEEEGGLSTFFNKSDSDVNREISKRGLDVEIDKKIGVDKEIKNEKEIDVSISKSPKLELPKEEPPKFETIKEFKKAKPSGIYVSTSDYNYVISSPKLAVLGWKAVAVNNGEVVIVLTNKKVKSTKLHKLDPEAKELLEKIVRGFTSNLKKVALNNPHVPNSLTYPRSYYASPQAYTPGYAKPPISGGSYVSGNGNYGGAGYGGKGSVGYGNKGSAGYGAKESNGYGSNEGSANYGSTGSAGGSYGGSGAYGGSYSGSKSSGSSYGGYSRPLPFCSKQNYQNLFGTKLNHTLDGDIYLLDLNGNALDILSSTVSLYCKGGISAIYRDGNYFAFSRPGLPLSINRIILNGKLVIIVYNNGAVAAKQSWGLNLKELGLVVQARAEIEELIKLRDLIKQSEPKEEKVHEIVKEELKKEPKGIEYKDDYDGEIDVEA